MAQNVEQIRLDERGRPTHCGDGRLRLGDGDVLRDGAWGHSVQTCVLHPGRGLGGLGFLLSDPRRLLLGRQAVLAAAGLALLHAGRTGGHGHFGATHCTFNRAG